MFATISYKDKTKHDHVSSVNNKEAKLNRI